MTEQFKIDVPPLPYSLEHMVVCDRTDALLDEVHKRGGCKQMEIHAAAVIATALQNVAIHIAARKAKGETTYSLRDYLEPLVHHAETVLDEGEVKIREHYANPPENLFGLIFGRRPK